MTYIPQSLPATAVEILNGQSKARGVSDALYASYWLFGHSQGTALFMLRQAHSDLADLADAMGYTLTRKPGHTTSIAGLKTRLEMVCGAMNKGTWPGSEADALAEIERIKGEIAEQEAAA